MNEASWQTIALDGRRTEYEPGERVSGRVSWAGTETPKLVELHLLWYTEGKGDQDVEVVASVTFPPSVQGSSSFELALPAGPWSVSGTLVSVLWAVELVVDPGGVAREIIAVAPGGKEVQLATGGPPEQAAARP